MDKTKAVIEAARRIRHWHDALADNSGMVVSAEHVRALWAALAALDQSKDEVLQRKKLFQVCGTCGGRGETVDNTGDYCGEPCPACHGTGKTDGSRNE